MAAVEAAPQPMDLETFFRQAKYPLVKYTDMSAEMREEAMDICITAVEKYPTDTEKCTQVGATCALEGHVDGGPGEGGSSVAETVAA